MARQPRAPIGRIVAAARPFIVTFHNSGNSYPLTAAEVQRVLDEYPAVVATKYRVVLQGHNSGRAADRTTIRPATLGGGPAFTIERPAAAVE
jgi:hypothetical protein